jgi:hypothetical protein
MHEAAQPDAIQDHLESVKEGVIGGRKIFSGKRTEHSAEKERGPEWYQ